LSTSVLSFVDVSAAAVAAVDVVDFDLDGAEGSSSCVRFITIYRFKHCTGVLDGMCFAISSQSSSSSTSPPSDSRSLLSSSTAFKRASSSAADHETLDFLSSLLLFILIVTILSEQIQYSSPPTLFCSSPNKSTETGTNNPPRPRRSIQSSR